jgi:hypothetical protein
MSVNLTARFCDLVMLLRKQPRTVRDLCEVQGADSDKTIRKWVTEMHAAGLLYIVEYRRTPHAAWPAVYAWQPEPFQCEDIQREEMAA